VKNRVDFSFGRNWQTFLKNFDEERLRIAESSLLEFMNLVDLKGKSFLDIGCGSGLFSYAAFDLGAERVVSFDPDPDCLQCCDQLRARAGRPDNWQIHQGSILDRSFVSQLGTFDIVYAWGVLHHTGKMWEAIKTSARLVNPDGYYYIAIYNKILTRDGRASGIHEFWTRVKRFYNSHPICAALVLRPAAMAAYLAMIVLHGQNPVAHVRNYKSHRGMSWSTDATDWLGGYPYEYATVEEIFKFIKGVNPDLNLVNLKITSGRGLNWYLYEKRRI
jgi:2-polyprenyl-6-hydroxyphenyl methylase/3-demethylubiquinone-9 3-methyltransferase